MIWLSAMVEERPVWAKSEWPVLRIKCTPGQIQPGLRESSRRVAAWQPIIELTLGRHIRLKWMLGPNGTWPLDLNCIRICRHCALECTSGVTNRKPPETKRMQEELKFVRLWIHICICDSATPQPNRGGVACSHWSVKLDTSHYYRVVNKSAP